MRRAYGRPRRIRNALRWRVHAAATQRAMAADAARHARYLQRVLGAPETRHFLWDLQQSRGWLHGTRLAEALGRGGSGACGEEAREALLLAIDMQFIEANAPRTAIDMNVGTTCHAQYRRLPALLPFLQQIDTPILACGESRANL